VRDSGEADDIGRRTALPVYGWIPEDGLIRDFDFRGRPLTDLPAASPALETVSRVLEKLGIGPSG
jgi:hypothetical protein